MELIVDICEHLRVDVMNHVAISKLFVNSRPLDGEGRGDVKF